MNRVLTSDDIIDNIEEYDGWKPYICNMSGTLEWDDGMGIFIYATPNWDEEGVTPFAIYTEESGEYETVENLFIDPNHSLDFQLESYVNTLKSVIKKVGK